jgi:hypothetical protein
MTEGMLQQALAYASLGRPVFPCQPGQKIPATRHGYRDATTDQERITAWFSLLPPWNLAIVTGTPGPDVLDVDQHGPVGNGFAALERLRRAGLLDGASTCVRTPSGGLHLYFAGSDQQAEGNRNAALFWAASRALETDRVADLSLLADAARHTSLAEPEITRTLDSARKTREARARQPDHDAEASR